ncbi:aldo/keto reductase family protein [Williamsoniiplasma lucivorax]|uniref:Aldo/keto reductase n=1 Tax=Williamsoniiplasma lucivorax TaxID=209274 RepID=A0A2S5RDU1_9MOLU|nr:aldo/keto reductase [Williamsoniiplasma lucivorax]PPE05483.1 aldo/keto reductase [Williamsoniiplasma lucivorax]
MQKIYFGTMTKLEETYDAMIQAFKAGYQIFDFADTYSNQHVIGQAITAWFKDNPHLKREDYFFQSKIWTEDIDNHLVDQEVEKILKDLNLTYIDSLLLHRPSMTMANSIAAYQKLLVWKAKGKVKHVGVSNFEKEQLMLLWATTSVKPEFNQFEMSVFNQRWDRILFAQKFKIEIQAYGSFKGINDCPELSEIAHKYHATNAQVVIAWLKHYDLDVILKSTNPDHIKENLKPIAFQLTNAELEMIKKLNRFDNFYPDSFTSDLVEDFYAKIKQEYK